VICCTTHKTPKKTENQKLGSLFLEGKTSADPLAGSFIRFRRPADVDLKNGVTSQCLPIDGEGLPSRSVKNNKTRRLLIFTGVPTKRTFPLAHEAKLLRRAHGRKEEQCELTSRTHKNNPKEKKKKRPKKPERAKTAEATDAEGSSLVFLIKATGPRVGSVRCGSNWRLQAQKRDKGGHAPGWSTLLWGANRSLGVDEEKKRRNIKKKRWVARTSGGSE